MTEFQWIMIPVWLWLSGCLAMWIWILAGWSRELRRKSRRLEGIDTQLKKFRKAGLISMSDSDILD